MSTTTYDPGGETPRTARHGFVSTDWKREVRRAVNMTAWLERGPVEAAATNIVPLPKRERVAHAATGGSATILFFTGVTRVRA